MTEHDKAKAWREARGLSIEQLSNLSGYAKQTLYWMERGEAPPHARGKKPQPVSEFVWQRYRNVCAGVDAQLRAKRNFNWGI